MEPFEDDDDDSDSFVELGAAADVWSLGMILYELVYGGVSPFATVPGGKASKVAALRSGQQLDFPEPCTVPR